ncbi:PilN domain-containing protein [Pseudomonas sp. zfem002]|uniref:PilN domain-containing protein n=1 Tax=Pseudomonas sp. zfem002 TaxID=3078197 RepID=UPI00292887C1|nr:PilN domain-containing protein [Pseudomonas sp. zfem002]MDU9389547.1 PilN domain-containing protein [Pseudomonas sp. zfem002]
MGEVNLLPWREWQRLRAVRRWQAALLGCLVSGLLLTLVLAALLSQHLERWRTDNQVLETRITGLAEGLAQVAVLRERGEDLQVQLEALRELQAQRTSGSDLLSTLMAIVPAGVRLEELTWADGELRLTGLARGGADVAQLLHHLRMSPGLGMADLQALTSSSAGERFRLLAGRRTGTAP